MRYLVMAAALLTAAAAPALAADPFAQPVKDCHPCRFSPGPGQPTFDLSFMFRGSGDQKALTGLAITQEGTQHMQTLAVDSLAVADFSDGFILDTTDMNFDGLRDLSIVTQVAADNSDAKYWIYQPASHDFVPLERVDDGEDNDFVLSPTSGHELICHVHDTNLEHTDTWYRVSGHRAVAVREESLHRDGALIVDASYDLSVTPKRLLHRETVGFFGDSPARTAFVRDLEAASQRAAPLYRHGDAAAAAAAIKPVIGDKELELVTSSYPITDDPGDATLVREFNDYGFYLQQAGRQQDAIGVLSAVVDVDPERTVAYLNLADAQYAAGQQADAKQNYAAYRQRMDKAGKLAAVPARVAERMP